MMRFDLLHDSSPHLRIGLVLPDIVHHLPDSSNHHIRTVDIYMVPAAAGDDATALRRQRFQALLQLVPDRLRRDGLSVPPRLPPVGIPRDGHERNVGAATRFRRLIGGMPKFVPLGKPRTGVRRATRFGPSHIAPCVEPLLNLSLAVSAKSSPSRRLVD